ncbi:MAG: hypothetical protein ACYS1C_10270, partial [Planctomycetota bacterium]
RLIVIRALGGPLLRAVNFRQLAGGNPWAAGLRIVGGLLVGRRLKDQLRKHTTVRSAMLMVILPFEESHSVESARLETCPSAFAYEDPDTDAVRTMPVCMWGLYKNDIQRRIAEKYQAVEAGENV